MLCVLLEGLAECVMYFLAKYLKVRRVVICLAAYAQRVTILKNSGFRRGVANQATTHPHCEAHEETYPISHYKYMDCLMIVDIATLTQQR